MTKSDFITLINLMRDDHDRTMELYRLGVDIINYDAPARMVTILGREAFGDKWDWVEWFCIEADFGRKETAIAEDGGKRVCLDVEGLWELVKDV